MSLLEKGRSYTFRSYFEMPYEIDEILAEFGVGFMVKDLAWRREETDALTIESLKAELQSRLKRVRLSSETARREALVSPILFSVTERADGQLRIEYSLAVDDQLKGKLDYFVKGKQSLLVVEAKNDDLTRGFTQLAVELLALSRKEITQKKLYGAVTVGDIWQFGLFDVEAQMIFQDTFLYRVPTDLKDVMEILIGILTTDHLATA